jgi:hypothetical protein
MNVLAALPGQTKSRRLSTGHHQVVTSQVGVDQVAELDGQPGDY